jgi:hypothetical protein
MAVSNKNEEPEPLARELAERTGVPITEVITIALREQLARDECKRSGYWPTMRGAARSRHSQSGRVRIDQIGLPC